RIPTLWGSNVGGGMRICSTPGRPDGKLHGLSHRVVLQLSLIAFAIQSGGILRAAETPVEFNRDVRPILSDTCFKCHGRDASARQAELRMDIRDDAIRPREGDDAF